ncbi:MAG: hypothetical protein Q9213_004665 [Squamulea squamosa]
MFQSIFRTKGKIESGIEKKLGELRSVSSISQTTTSSTAAPSRHRGLGPKLRIQGSSMMEPSVPQAAFCLPSCPVDDDMHRPGLYLHEGKMSNSLSFLFGANNPPSDVKAAHGRLIMGVASEEDEELILLFLAHHPFQSGAIMDEVYFNTEKPEMLVMQGNPLSFTDPEVESTVFVPIRVAPIKAAG